MSRRYWQNTRNRRESSRNRRGSTRRSTIPSWILWNPSRKARHGQAAERRAEPDSPRGMTSFYHVISVRRFGNLPAKVSHLDIRLPLDSTSRRTPLPSANASYCRARSGLSPLGYSTCWVHKKAHCNVLLQCAFLLWATPHNSRLTA